MKISTYFAKLRGRNQVPPVRTDACGEAIFSLSEDGCKVFFIMNLKNVDHLTVAHIHVGIEGVNGPVVVTLFGPLTKAVTIEEGTLKGSFTRNDLEGPLAGRSLSTLFKLIRRENAYVNVHTVQNPDGEIRGQIRRR